MSETRFGAKACTVKFKTDNLAEGEFIAYASIFDTKDSDGDVVVKGAFAKSIKTWGEKGNPIPLLWGHVTTDPDFNIGEIISAEEDERGLKVHGRVDMESPKGPQSYRLMKSGRVNNLSYAYAVTDGSYVAAKSAYEIREVDLFEVSIVPIGANQETEILAVKSAAASLVCKAGRTLSAKNENALRGVLAQADEIASAIKSVLSAVDDGADEKDQDQTSGEEPPSETEKSSDVATPTPSVSLAMTLIEIESQGDLEL